MKDFLDSLNHKFGLMNKEIDFLRKERDELREKGKFSPLYSDCERTQVVKSICKTTLFLNCAKITSANVANW